MPLGRVTFSIACANLPQLHLVCPVQISNDFVFGDKGSQRLSWNVVKSVVLEEIVPEDEGGSDGLTVQLVIPALKHGHDLVALFANVFVREEKEFGLAVDIDEKIFSFFDERIGLEVSGELEEGVWGELVPGQIAASIDQELLFCGIHDFFLEVSFLIFCGEMCITHNQEVPFEVGNPSFLTVLGGSSQVWIKEIRRVFLHAEILEYSAAVGDD